MYTFVSLHLKDTHRAQNRYNDLCVLYLIFVIGTRILAENKSLTLISAQSD